MLTCKTVGIHKWHRKVRWNFNKMQYHKSGLTSLDQVTYQCWKVLFISNFQPQFSACSIFWTQLYILKSNNLFSLECLTFLHFLIACISYQTFDLGNPLEPTIMMYNMYLSVTSNQNHGWTKGENRPLFWLILFYVPTQARYFLLGLCNSARKNPSHCQCILAINAYEMLLSRTIKFKMK